ncbi:hypothetical protein NGM37_01665, partial [Streptomyces sp. TRM76130]|nr:hypothetical protein [Streptomyces sp. TRM76130]
DNADDNADADARRPNGAGRLRARADALSPRSRFPRRTPPSRQPPPPRTPEGGRRDDGTT